MTYDNEMGTKGNIIAVIARLNQLEAKLNGPTRTSPKQSTKVSDEAPSKD